jgi:hypothetical protein
VALGALGYSSGPISVCSSDSSVAAKLENCLQDFHYHQLSMLISQQMVDWVGMHT